MTPHSPPLDPDLLDDAPPDPRPEEVHAPSLPVDGRDGVVPVAITSEWEIRGLLQGSIASTMMRTALPAVASNLLMTLFASVDAFWIGTRIGAGGLAAVTTSLFWIWMGVAVAEMVSVGLTAVAARRHGEGRHREAAHVVGEGIVYAVLLGGVIGMLGFAFLPRLFALSATPDDVVTMGRAYLGTYLIGAPLIFGYFAVDAAFRASGDTRTPFLLLAGSVAVTLVLDPLLILGLAGFPQLGIAGAAVATVATRTLVFIVGLTLLLRRRMVSFRKLRLRSVANISRVGGPTAVTGVMFSLIYIVMSRTTAQFGTPALAALGLGHRIESWLYMIGVGFGAASAAIIGQNIGAGMLDRAERAGWIAVAWASAPGVLFCVMQLFFPAQLASLYTDDPAVIAETVKYLRIAAFSQLVICSEIGLEGALGGAGATVAPMLTSTVFTAMRIPLAAWAASRWGTEGLWWVISLTAMARGLAMLAIWASGSWKKHAI